MGVISTVHDAVPVIVGTSFKNGGHSCTGRCSENLEAAPLYAETVLAEKADIMGWLAPRLTKSVVDEVGC